MLPSILSGALAICSLTLASALPAQTRSQEELIAARDKKLGKPVFHTVNWLFDYDEARTRAQRTGKLLFTYFTRSYAY